MKIFEEWIKRGTIIGNKIRGNKKLLVLFNEVIKYISIPNPMSPILDNKQSARIWKIISTSIEVDIKL